MRYRIFLTLAISLVLTASVALAQCPVPGMYMSSGGAMLEGRASSGWCGLDGSPGWGEPGNTYNAMSLDEGVLGTQWKVWGQTIDANGALEIDSQIDGNGNGWIAYSIHYEGGEFWFAENGPWGGDSDVDLTGPLTSWSVQMTVTYVQWFPAAATSNVTATGLFNDCPGCEIEFFIANTLLMWRDEWGDQGIPIPDGYPPFLCGATTGELEEVCCVVMSIGCEVVPTQQSTWGEIKTLYR